MHHENQGFEYESFIEDQRTVDAVARNLEIIGEAVKHLPEEMTHRFPEIPWKAIAGFRDILAHCTFVLKTQLSGTLLGTTPQLSPKQPKNSSTKKNSNQ